MILLDTNVIAELLRFAPEPRNFDLAATQAYAELMAKAQPTGQPIGMADGVIAAIAKANGMTVATWDVTPFNTAGVSVIDPWSAI